MGRANPADGGSGGPAGGDGRSGRAVFGVVRKLIAGEVRVCSGASAGDHLSDGEFPAWRMAAPDREHVVSVAGRFCSRRRLGPPVVYGVLSRCGRGGVAILRLDESREHHSLRGGLGGRGGADGSVPGALPQDEDPDVVDSRFLPHLPVSGSGILVVAAVGAYRSVLWFPVRQDERGCALGTCRRIRFRRTRRNRPALYRL